MPEYAWICLKNRDKILNFTGFSICERYTIFWICQNMPWQSSEYISGSKYVRVLNMAEFWISHIQYIAWGINTYNTIQLRHTLRH